MPKPLSANDRLKLSQRLSSLPPPQFNELITAIQPPSGVVPPPYAAQGDRVSALLHWLDSPTGKHKFDAFLGLFDKVASGAFSGDQPPTYSSIDNLPELRYFQGRTPELEGLAVALADPNMSIIGVRGDGGIGKSTLAAKAFLDSPGFEGRFWIDVRTQPAITTLATQALLELGVPIADVDTLEEKDRPQRLLRHLQTGHYLLAIDNLESLLNSAGEWQGGYGAFLEQFRDNSGQSVLLLASREYPQHYYSWLRSHWLVLERGFTPSEGATLLKDLEIEGSDEALEAASAEVRGHPLALTLIAGWIRTAAGRSGPRQVTLLEQAGDYFQITGRYRGESDRSLESVLNWSLERLSSNQQNLLTQVSVLRGWFTAETVEAMVSETMNVATALQDLERRSLLQETAGPEYRLQPRIQELVQRQAGYMTAAHKRAIKYFWQRRIIDFASSAPKEAAADYFEVFHHEVQLQRWSDAAETMMACCSFLSLAGGYQDLADHYELLHQQWQPSPEQRKHYSVVCSQLGIIYNVLGEYRRAIDFHEQSLEISRAIGDRAMEALTLSNLGNEYSRLGDSPRAIEFHEQSLENFHTIGNRAMEAFVLSNLGNAYRVLGDSRRAIECHEQSLEIFRTIGDREEKSTSLGSLGNAYDSLGEPRRAINYSEEQLSEILQTILDGAGKAAALNGLGNAYGSLGEYRRAIDFQEQSLEILRAIGDRAGEATTLNSLGNAYGSLSEYRRAIDCHEQSLEISRAIGARGGEAMSLRKLGIVYKNLGEYRRAIEFQEQSLEIARTIGDHEGEAAALSSLGNTYGSLGEHRRAAEFQEQSLEILRAIGDRESEANALNSLGNAYYSLGEYHRAIDFHEQSLEIARAIGNREDEAMFLRNLGNAYDALGEHRRAIEFQEQSLEIARTIGDRRSEAAALMALSQLHHLCGNPKEGFAAGMAARKVLLELNLPLQAWSLPKWMKSTAKFAQRGTVQLALCLVLGLLAFPFALVAIVVILIWRLLMGRFRR